MRSLQSALPYASGQSNSWRRDPSVPRGRKVRIFVDGEPVDAHEGESLAVALAVEGTLAIRHSPVAGGARGMFCLMGVCQECIVRVDGESATSCTEPVREGMQVVLGTFNRDQLTSA